MAKKKMTLKEAVAIKRKMNASSKSGAQMLEELRARQAEVDAERAVMKKAKREKDLAAAAKRTKDAMSAPVRAAKASKKYAESLKKKGRTKVGRRAASGLGPLPINMQNRGGAKFGERISMPKGTGKYIPKKKPSGPVKVAKGRGDTLTKEQRDAQRAPIKKAYKAKKAKQAKFRKDRQRRMRLEKLGVEDFLRMEQERRIEENFQQGLDELNPPEVQDQVQEAAVQDAAVQEAVAAGQTGPPTQLPAEPPGLPEWVKQPAPLSVEGRTFPADPQPEGPTFEPPASTLAPSPTEVPDPLPGSVDPLRMQYGGLDGTQFREAMGDIPRPEYMQAPPLESPVAQPGVNPIPQALQGPPAMSNAPQESPLAQAAASPFSGGGPGFSATEPSTYTTTQYPDLVPFSARSTKYIDKFTSQKKVNAGTGETWTPQQEQMYRQTAVMQDKNADDLADKKREAENTAAVELYNQQKIAAGESDKKRQEQEVAQGSPSDQVRARADKIAASTVPEDFKAGYYKDLVERAIGLGGNVIDDLFMHAFDSGNDGLRQAIDTARGEESTGAEKGGFFGFDNPPSFLNIPNFIPIPIPRIRQ